MKPSIHITLGLRSADRANRWMHGALLGLISLLGVHGSIAADGSIAVVQSTLIREKFLFGEPSGVLDDATREALRRFQTYRSLPASGELDPATLQALQSNPPTLPAKPAETPVAPATKKADREFLAQLISSREPVPAVSAPANNPPPSSLEAVAEQSIPRLEPTPPVSPGSPKAGLPVRHPDEETLPPKPHQNIATARESTPLHKKDPSIPVAGMNREAESPQPVRLGQSKPALPIEVNRESEDLTETHVKVVRTRTTSTDADGHTHVSVVTTTTSWPTTPPLATRDPAEGRSHPKGTGLFDRLFHDNGRRGNDD